MQSTLTPNRSQSVSQPRDSFSMLRKEMDDLLANFCGTGLPNWLNSPMPTALDIVESDNSFVIKMDAPGLEAKDFNVQVHGNTLTVSGQRQEEKESKDKTFYRMERKHGSFSRTVALPCNVNEGEAAAEYTNGVLTLTLPKAEGAKTKKISVKGA